MKRDKVITYTKIIKTLVAWSLILVGTYYSSLNLLDIKKTAEYGSSPVFETFDAGGYETAYSWGYYYKVNTRKKIAKSLTLIIGGILLSRLNIRKLIT